VAIGGWGQIVHKWTVAGRPGGVPAAPDLTVRLARRGLEVAAAQALRYRVFYKEMGAAASLTTKMLRRDADRFDRACDHIIVLDRQRRIRVPAVFGQVVGTCRLMRREVAAKRGGFYSAAEFNLAPLLAQPLACLELGRSCIDPDYRSRAAIDRLWRGIADYVVAHRIGLMFGCASLPGTDPDKLAATLTYLHHYHLAPAESRPCALPGRYVAMSRLPISQVDPKAVLAGMPPLLKGYLRLGAMIGDGAVIDHQFNTTDVCIVLPTAAVTTRYLRHYRAEAVAGRAA
jgi:putative hemolysin